MLRKIKKKPSHLNDLIGFDEPSIVLRTKTHLLTTRSNKTNNSSSVKADKHYSMPLMLISIALSREEEEVEAN